MTKLLKNVAVFDTGGRGQRPHLLNVDLVMF